MGLDVTGRYRYPPPNPEWLALTGEPVLDRNLAIVDSHHHLWEQDGHPYLLEQIAEDLDSGHNVKATVFVQAHYGYRSTGPAHLAPVGETEKVTAIARQAAALGLPRIAAAIVAHADLTLGDRVEEVLLAHEAAADGALRGIRHSVSRDPNFPDGVVLRPAPPALLADKNYRAGLRAMQRMGLSYDAMLYNCQITELTEMADAMPGLPIVLDHIGCILGVGLYEGREAELLAQWRKDIAELARRDNVSVKIGGFGMIVCGARWHEAARPPASDVLAEAWRPYVETCIELFGARRCMFESNFPVDKAMYTYRALWNAFKRLTSSASPDERGELFSGTAARFYRISDLTNQKHATVSHDERD
ncbi:amidohydrolase family protein [Novosphingobium percolationis]|uniref:amidohydrolase family protein n=1 Tax=Novosphingobium percolationis TaxID=2871811 RepID=UPI001CD3136E|nr:amidohydrolase family protein [Novosphingobium percolationis]